MKHEVKRKSNFELLRIIAMLMIIGSHLACHGVQHCLSTEDAYQLYLEGSYINKITTSLFTPGGEVGVAIFFMITGYFQINKDRISLLKVVLECYFYAWLMALMYLALSFWGNDLSTLTTAEIISFFVKALITPVTGEVWGFVSAYVLLIVISPTYNKVLNKMNRKGYCFIILTIWGIWYSLPRLYGVSVYYTLQRGVMFYTLGAYVRKYDRVLKTIYKKTIYILLLLFNWIAYAYTDYYIIHHSAMDNLLLIDKIRMQMIMTIRSSILVFIAAYLIFKLFESINLEYNFLINKIASTTFGIYLFHDSYVGRNYIWYDILKIDTYFYEQNWFPIYSVFIILVVFMLGGIIDIIRQRFIEPIVVEQYNKIKIFFDKKCMI